RRFPAPGVAYWTADFSPGNIATFFHSKLFNLGAPCRVCRSIQFSPNRSGQACAGELCDRFQALVRRPVCCHLCASARERCGGVRSLKAATEFHGQSQHPLKAEDFRDWSLRSWTNCERARADVQAEPL